MAYQLPDLAYAFDALEPHIDAKTMEIHHDKHHAAYVTNLNAALEGTEWMDRPIEAVLSNLEILPADKQAAVRNNGGGHANHTLFWETLSPNGGGEPTGALGEAVGATFGAFDVLKQQMVDAGIKRFGSGWSWLVWDGTGLAVLSTPNQDSPISRGQDPALRDRRVGARLLPQVPEPPPGVPRGDLERRRLERGRRELRGGEVARPSPGAGPRPRPRRLALPWAHDGGRRRGALPIRSAPDRVDLDVDAVLPLRLLSGSRVATIGRVTVPEPTDAALIERVADHEREAFEELYARYARPVLGLALRRLGDRGRAEDSVQEVFAAVWRSASSYDRSRGPGGAWLYTIARNAIVDVQRRRTLPTVADPPELVGDRPDARRGGRVVLERLARPPGARDAAGARAGGDRPRVLLRPLAERGGGVPPHPARHRQDANAQRARPARRCARGRAVSQSPTSVRRPGRGRRSRSRAAAAGTRPARRRGRAARAAAAARVGAARAEEHPDHVPAPSLHRNRGGRRGCLGAASASATRSAAATARTSRCRRSR